MKTHCSKGHPLSGDNLYVFPNGRHRACRACRREAKRRARLRDPAKARRQARETSARRYAVNGAAMRLSQRLRKYGITAEELQEMRSRQGGCCAACPTPLAESEHIDHCHATGQVRGLLCSRCNLTLGHVKDDPAILRMLIAYLEGSYAPA